MFKSAEQKKKAGMHVLKSQSIFSEAFQREWRDHLISNLNFRFSLVNGKYPLAPEEVGDALSLSTSYSIIC